MADAERGEPDCSTALLVNDELFQERAAARAIFAGLSSRGPARLELQAIDGNRSLPGARTGAPDCESVARCRLRALSGAGSLLVKSSGPWGDIARAGSLRRSSIWHSVAPMAPFAVLAAVPD